MPKLPDDVDQTGALLFKTTMLNCLSAVFDPPVALIVNVDVVSYATAGAVPVIAPVVVFKLKPLGKLPLCKL